MCTTRSLFSRRSQSMMLTTRSIPYPRTQTRVFTMKSRACRHEYEQPKVPTSKILHRTTLCDIELSFSRHMCGNRLQQSPDILFDMYVYIMYRYLSINRFQYKSFSREVLVPRSTVLTFLLRIYFLSLIFFKFISVLIVLVLRSVLY